MSLNANSPLGKILSKLLDLVILQLFFLVTSIPVFTIGAGLSAMFAVCRKIQQDSVTSVVKLYFSEFRSCFKKSTVAWLIVAIAGALLGMSISYYYHASGAFHLIPLVIACALAVIVYVEFLFVFPLIAWFDNDLFSHFKNAPVLAVFHFKTTLLLTALYAFVFLLAVPILPITFFIAFSGSALYATLLLTKVFVQHDPSAAPPEQTEEEEEDTAE